MKNRKTSIAVLAALAAGLVFGPSHASKGIPSERGRSVRATKFSVSGVYSGALSGSVLLGTESVEIADGVRPYQVGTGFLDEGAVVTSAGVYASGVVRRGKMFATSVIVSETESSQDYSETTLPDVEADPSRAR